MRRELITWGVVGAIVVGAFAGTVAILNSTLYSASGFAQSYLDALARHDADGALDLAGASLVTQDVSRELLVPDAMGELTDVELVSDTEDESGVHSVVFTYLIGGQPAQSTFEVQRQGTLLGLFPTWSFTTSPLGVVSITVLHADTFTGNGVPLVTPNQNDPAPYLVFTPGMYEFGHESTYLSAQPIQVEATEPGASVPAALKVEANEKFIRAAQKAVNASLDQCATQEVLLPTGCPFGQVITNRVVSTPAWSIATYPPVTIEGSDTPNEWFMPPTPAAAHLVVDVRSLFDGTVTTFDEDVPFVVSYVITFVSDDEIALTARY